jgi:hypothetical protein
MTRPFINNARAVSLSSKEMLLNCVNSSAVSRKVWPAVSSNTDKHHKATHSKIGEAGSRDLGWNEFARAFRFKKKKLSMPHGLPKDLPSRSFDGFENRRY